MEGEHQKNHRQDPYFCLVSCPAVVNPTFSLLLLTAVVSGPGLASSSRTLTAYAPLFHFMWK